MFGQGDPAARLMFVGEAPGADEDEQGLAFVGRAGQLLTKIIEAIGMRREDVKLRDAFNKALGEMMSDGTYKKLNETYFPFPLN